MVSHFADLSREELAVVVPELLLMGQLIDRSGMAWCISAFGREGLAFAPAHVGQKLASTDDLAETGGADSLTAAGRRPVPALTYGAPHQRVADLHLILKAGRLNDHACHY